MKLKELNRMRKLAGLTENLLVEDFKEIESKIEKVLGRNDGSFHSFEEKVPSSSVNRLLITSGEQKQADRADEILSKAIRATDTSTPEDEAPLLKVIKKVKGKILIFSMDVIDPDEFSLTAVVIGNAADGKKTISKLMKIIEKEANVTLKVKKIGEDRSGEFIQITDNPLVASLEEDTAVEMDVRGTVLSR